jgi:hypothetical protein
MNAKLKQIAKHTPGPWEFGTPGDGGRVNVYADSTMSLRICRVDSGQDIGIDAAANAKLIAAAPDLAEALRAILEFDSMDYSMHIRGMQKIARAALAKAGL